MEEEFKMNLDWVQNPWFTLTGWIFGLVGLVVGIYFGVKGNHKKQLTCTIVKCDHLISKGRKIIPKLRLFFEDKEIEDIAITSCVIWNTGTETIDGSDVVSENTIKITAEDNCRILDARILATNKTTNNFRLMELSDSAFEVKFDYVDKNQGAKIQIVHEGKSVAFRCEIKGGNFKVSGKINNKAESPYFRLHFLKSLANMSVWTAFIYLVFFVVGYLNQINIIELPEIFMTGLWRDLRIFDANIFRTIFSIVICMLFFGGCHIILYKSDYRDLPKSLYLSPYEIDDDLRDNDSENTRLLKD